jgi:hypothetical protein
VRVIGTPPGTTLTKSGRHQLAAQRFQLHDQVFAGDAVAVQDFGRAALVAGEVEGDRLLVACHGAEQHRGAAPGAPPAAQFVAGRRTLDHRTNAAR